MHITALQVINEAVSLPVLRIIEATSENSKFHCLSNNVFFIIHYSIIKYNSFDTNNENSFDNIEQRQEPRRFDDGGEVQLSLPQREKCGGRNVPCLRVSAKQIYDRLRSSRMTDEVLLTVIADEE